MGPTLMLLVSTLLWGVWGYVNKLAVSHAHPLTVQWMYYLPSLLLIPAFYLIGSRLAPETNLDGMALRYAVISGLAAAAAGVFYFFALQSMSASVAVAITAAYPVITLLIGALSGEETVDLRKLIGIAIIIVGVVIVQSESG